MLVSDRRGDVWAIITSGRVLLYLPLVIVLLALTAGFTEELFFRGLLQTRLASWLRSEPLGLLIAATLFGLYHLPYVYLTAASGLYGDLGGALLECGYDAIAGVIIGLVFWRARHNLLAAGHDVSRETPPCSRYAHTSRSAPPPALTRSAMYSAET